MGKSKVMGLQVVLGKLEQLFKTFNAHIFNGELETPVITIAPDTTRGAYGWCTSWKAWKDTDGSGFFEINVCAEYLTRPFEQVCGTLLHEMVHLKNLQGNVQDTSRNGYFHNKKFKLMAETHGLTVEKTKNGWSKTTLTPETAEWLKCEFPNDTGFTLYREKKIKATATQRVKSYRYICHNCDIIVRATKEVCLICGICNAILEKS
ncbi:MAG: SprT-like domain-containing protein [Oscillospiraceae bacterium]|nr:SprT-like domain-containing protein [Oscillospiraceae bacterium]